MGKRGEREGRGGEGMYRSAPPPFSNPGYATDLKFQLEGPLR
jgi:hypothetical protein